MKALRECSTPLPEPPGLNPLPKPTRATKPPHVAATGPAPSKYVAGFEDKRGPIPVTG